MTALRTAAKQALEVLERAGEELRWQAIGQVQRALRAALAEPDPFNPDWDRIAPLQENLREHMAEIQRLRSELALQRFTDVNQELEAALAEPVQESQCNPHPKAPHSFMRNASHTEDRYVCECEAWDPWEAGYQAGMEAALRDQA
jgi:hypothetical protein